MKNLTLLVFFSVLSIFFSGCQAGESSSEASKANRTANSASNGPGTVTQSVPGAPDANGNYAPANADNSTGPLQDIKSRKMDPARGPMSDQPGIATQAQPFSRPAPDNSVYSVSLADEAVETRTFKDNPQLLKVEKRSNGSQSSIKVYLKDGRVIDLPGDKIAAMSMASASDMLSAAGVSHGAAASKK